MDHASLLKQFEHLDPHNQNTFEAKDLELLITTVTSSREKLMGSCVLTRFKCNAEPSEPFRVKGGWMRGRQSRVKTKMAGSVCDEGISPWQATKDLENYDAERHEEFKRYEMLKEHERREYLKGLDQEKREREEKRLQELKDRHRQHPKVNAPV